MGNFGGFINNLRDLEPFSLISFHVISLRYDEWMLRYNPSSVTVSAHDVGGTRTSSHHLHDVKRTHVDQFISCCYRRPWLPATKCPRVRPRHQRGGYFTFTNVDQLSVGNQLEGHSRRESSQP